MTSRQHRDWINRGKPDSGLALPLQLLANTLAAAGYTVFVYPNDAHLDAEPPEDHTYYSETGWPGTSPKWWRHAIDIMPGHPGLPSLQTIGQNLFNARQSGQITWLKYMNWPSDGNLSSAVQDRWEPDHSRGSSSDTGHIHLSSITGVEVLDASFNPLTSVVLTDNPSEADVTPEEHTKLDAVYNLYDQVQLPGGGATQFQVPITKVIKGIAADVAAVKAVVATPPPVTLSPDQLNQVVAQVVAALGGLLPTLDVIDAAVDKAVKARLDGGTVDTAGTAVGASGTAADSSGT